MKWVRYGFLTMKPARLGLVLLGLAALAACGPRVKITRLVPAFPQPTTACEVFTTAPPDRPFVELALIEVYEGGSAVAREEAMQLGADAIILKKSVITGLWASPSGYNYKVIFVAVKWK